MKQQSDTNGDPCHKAIPALYIHFDHKSSQQFQLQFGPNMICCKVYNKLCLSGVKTSIMIHFIEFGDVMI